jgi:hypothetical protein
MATTSNLHRYIFGLFFLLGGMGTQAYAQPDRNLNEVVNVIRPYKPILADAVKIKTNPEIEDSAIPKVDIDFQVKPIKFDTLSELLTVQPEKIGQESISKLYNVYLNTGFGMQYTSVADLYVNSIQNKKWQTGMYIKHISSNGRPQYAIDNRQEAHLFATRIYKYAQWGGGLKYNRRTNYFYSVPVDTAESKADLRQRFQYAEAYTSVLTNSKKTNPFNFGFTARAGYFFDKYKADEKSLAGDLYFDKVFWNNRINLPVTTQLIQYKDSLGQQDNHLVNAGAMYNTTIDSNLSVQLGVQTATSFGVSNKFFMYPVFKASYALVPKVLIPYIGIGGGLKQTTFRGLARENPFIHSHQDLVNQNEKISIYGGTNVLIKAINFNAKVSHTYVDNLQLFMTDSSDNKRFVAVYAGKNSTVTTLDLEGSYHWNAKLNVGAAAQFNSYQVVTEEKAWYKPTSKLSGFVNYNLRNKLLVKSEIFVIGQRAVKDSLGSIYAYNLPVFVDLNAGIEYRYSKTLSFYLNFNNIIGKNYMIWLNYPSYKFNLL